MKIRVKIKTIGPIESGEKRDGGTWKARNLLLEEDGQFNADRFLVRLSGEKAENFQWQEGDVVDATIYFNVRTGEQTGRQFQDLYLANLEQLTMNS